MGKTPLELRRRVGDAAFVAAVDHPLYEVLHDLANPEQTAIEFKRSMMTQALLYGVAYAQIVRIDGRVEALWPLDSRQMRVDRDAQHRKRWNYSTAAGVTTWIFDASMPPIFELTIDTPVIRCRELIGTALAVQQYIGRFFGNGARPAGALILPPGNGGSPQSRKEIKEAWQAAFGRVENSHKLAVLDAGVEYKQFGSQNDHAQLVELAQSLRLDICGAFKMPPWKAGMLEKTSYSNLEAGELSYLAGTLDPLFVAWEQALARDLLTARQFGQFSISFDRASLIRTDTKALYDAIATGVQNGVLSVNEARRMVGLNPVDGGDEHVFNAALVPLKHAGKPTEPDRSRLAAATRQDLDDLAEALGADRVIQIAREGRAGQRLHLERRITGADDADLRVE